MNRDDEPEMVCEEKDGVFIARPRRRLSARSYLYACAAQSVLVYDVIPAGQVDAASYPGPILPDGIIPAGQYAIPGPPEEVEENLSYLEAAARKMAAVQAGGERGRREGHKTRRANADQERLIAAVHEYRARHPKHGRPTIAEALLPDFGPEVDHADPAARRRAIAALAKRIERLEKSLDT